MISVGILTAPRINVSFQGAWTCNGAPIRKRDMVVSCPTEFVPSDSGATFTLHNVTIGIDYHWQRQESQTFRGTLRVISDGDDLTAVNIVPIEEYLVSVISSEMKPTAHLEFLKAAAVISRSWAIKQKEHHAMPHQHATTPPNPPSDIIITWQDHQDHTLYDVCADDHCQRYQGITRITNHNAQLAVRQTARQVLTYDGKVCDCRFSKCCGGMTEDYATCWEDYNVPYLQPVADTDPQFGHAFCDTCDKKILEQVLNSYDLETTDFYRWTVSLTQEHLQELLKKKLQRNIGQVRALHPIKRGKSGRISQLLIDGTDGHLTIGKELTIRSSLSESHLYSSAFTVDASDTDANGVPKSFVLHGKGWGHGVGLCQIGAAVMADKGYSYQQILQHYYPHTTLQTIPTGDKGVFPFSPH